MTKEQFDKRMYDGAKRMAEYMIQLADRYCKKQSPSQAAKSRSRLAETWKFRVREWGHLKDAVP